MHHNIHAPIDELYEEYAPMANAEDAASGGATR